MATGLRLATERTGDGAGQPILDADDGEELVHVQPGVSIVLGNRPPESPGTLYISTKQVVWLSDTDRAKGYAVDFLSVSLHAVSRDPEAYSSPCIYTQIDTGAEDEESEGSDSECNDTQDLSKINEMRLVPSDANQLDTLFAVFCECAELNPGPIEAAVDEEDSDLIVSQNQTHSIGANGNHDLARSVLQLQINDQRFEDAEEMESDDKNGYH
ncbi:chloride conductance regulatory ICln [Olea europaea subsp. europaea]|uniref:Chloride conductance regulatory ICln n=1 Tax=Olea europaea subsp. europaea TaxID=158383 RepID=A0A8S0UUW3_OLEEU|nr:chloride conductance regulatory ICln [Olea europaea subsp. europaea]